ncbi:MAG: tetratricopeptide repeat protein, partial [Candidatus Marinimicrobia bacterium]|nr:tetratricopeptide repeat protein [Candidatus Neomarinimicrobiota bacterium]
MFLKSGYAVAQNVQIDSLKALLESTTDDSMRAEIILEIGSAYEQIDPYQSIAYAKQALDIFSILENDFGRGKALNMVGHYNWLMGVFKESIAYYKEALDLFYKLDKPDWIARVANNLGAVYWGLGDYNAALELYRESLALQTELGHLSNVALINNNIGLIYQKWQLYDEAMKYHRDA